MKTKNSRLLLLILFILPSVLMAGRSHTHTPAQIVCQRDWGYTVDQRLDALRKLPKTLVSEDIEHFFKFLRNGKLPEGLRRTQHYYLQNEMFVKLLNMSHTPEGIHQLLTDIVQDVSQATVLREYAQQYMVHFFPSQDGEARQLILNTLRKALEEKHNNIAGGAIMALRSIATDYPEIDLYENSLDLVRWVAIDPKAHVQSRIPAIQTMGSLSGSGFYKDALSIGKDENSPMLIRIASIAALGDIGDLHAIDWLLSLDNPASRLYLPAQAAIRKIQAKGGLK